MAIIIRKLRIEYDQFTFFHREINEICNLFHKRLFNLEIALQTNNQIKTRAYEYLTIFDIAFDQLNILSTNFNSSFQLLISLFRVLLLDSTEQFIDLETRLQQSEDQILKLKSQKKHFSNNNNLEPIHTLNDRLMEAKFRWKIASRYSQDWKQNHISQWTQMFIQHESDLQKELHQYEQILEQNESVHHETMKLLGQQTIDMQIKANQTYEFYETETTRFERDLGNYRWEYSQLKQRREDMINEYNRMKNIVDEYNQMKIDERLALEKQKQREEAIKIIQTWWKGIISRQKRKKKKKKKKKKKNK